MPDYIAPLQDMQFVLYNVFQADRQWQALELDDVTEELADAVLEESAKISRKVLAPLNLTGHEQGVAYNDGLVTTPEGFREAFATLAEGGWSSLAGDPEYGGQLMPKALTLLVEEMQYASNISLGLYLSLTAGAALAISAHGSRELKERYLPGMYEGRWAGSMCLTEAHAGTDLGLIRTKALPQSDGSYRITGTKIFITGGEHDLTENIVHLVLAKLPDAPAGSKGISLFLVPKFIPNDDGSLGARNGVQCGSIEHKMGINASATCVMNFDHAEGYLVGELNRGLACMFTMMNYERLSVGIQGLGAASAAYQWSLAYAKERLQGRSPNGEVQRDAAADPLLVHPDVRRMLMTQKAFVEGGRAFAVYVGQQLDSAKFGCGEARERAQDRVDLLTPIAKAFLTDKGFDGAVLGQQIFGGHGYIRETGVEQLVRDARITQIYEGANGIQAMDFVGRKLAANGGESMAALVAEIRQYIECASAEARMAEFLAPLREALDVLEALGGELLTRSTQDPCAVGAAANDMLHLAGYTLYGWMWARMAEVALQLPDSEFVRAKLKTARFFMAAELKPMGLMLAQRIRNASSLLMDMTAQEF